MTSETAYYGGENDTKWLSQNLWNLSGFLGMSPAELMLGSAVLDNFMDLPTGKYTATQATAGTFALTDEEGGVALASAGSTTATQGINVQYGGTAGETFVPTAGKDIYFETRVKVTANATGPEFFAGLAITDTSLIAGSALTSQAIGFKSVTDDNVLLATCKDGSSETTASSIHTFVTGTYVKLGVKIVGTSAAKFYVDGVLVATITANIPTTEMRVSFVCQSGGTTSPVAAFDWVAAWQPRDAG